MGGISLESLSGIPCSRYRYRYGYRYRYRYLIAEGRSNKIWLTNHVGRPRVTVYFLNHWPRVTVYFLNHWPCVKSQKSKGEKRYHVNILPNRWQHLPEGIGPGAKNLSLLINLDWHKCFVIFSRVLLQRKGRQIQNTKSNHKSNRKTHPCGNSKICHVIKFLIDEVMRLKTQPTFFLTKKLSSWNARALESQNVNGRRWWCQHYWRC